MDFEKSIKRLAVILLLSLVVIAIAKVLLSKAITSMGRAAAEKKVQAAPQLASAPSASQAPEAQIVQHLAQSSVVAESAALAVSAASGSGPSP